MGDATICTGVITGKRTDGPHCVVDLELASTNQRGSNTAPGTATVILPSREKGPVVLPVPENDTVQRGANILSRASLMGRNSEVNQ